MIWLRENFCRSNCSKTEWKMCFANPASAESQLAPVLRQLQDGGLEQPERIAGHAPAQGGFLVAQFSTYRLSRATLGGTNGASVLPVRTLCFFPGEQQRTPAEPGAPSRRGAAVSSKGIASTQAGRRRNRRRVAKRGAGRDARSLSGHRSCGDSRDGRGAL